MSSYDNAITSHIYIPGGLVNPDVSEIVSELISLTCITVLAVAMGSKTKSESAQSLSYGRILVYALYAVSWAFAVTSVTVVSTNNNNIVSCTIGMLGCDIFYAGSKIVIYAWLIERVHLVRAVKTDRLKSRQYRAHLLLLCPYIIIFVLMMTFRNIELADDGRCIIGLLPVASVPLLVYDLIFNSYLTWLFLKPLLNIGRSARKNWARTRLYNFARRTLVASLVCLLISFGNVLFVVISQGHQRGLICLTMCTVDVTVNVVTVHWVTTKPSKMSDADGEDKSISQTADHITAEMTFECDTVLAKSQCELPIVHPKHPEGESDSFLSVEIQNAK